MRFDVAVAVLEEELHLVGQVEALRPVEVGNAIYYIHVHVYSCLGAYTYIC